MMANQTRVALDMKVLEEKEKKFPGAADQIIGKLCLDAEADMKSSMSQDSPSSPGEPPAIVTGNLVNSIRAEKVKERVWRIAVGAEYGAALEYGSPANGLEARPFFEPAIKRMVKRAPSALKATIK